MNEKYELLSNSLDSKILQNIKTRFQESFSAWGEVLVYPRFNEL